MITLPDPIYLAGAVVSEEVKSATFRLRGVSYFCGDVVAEPMPDSVRLSVAALTVVSHALGDRAGSVDLVTKRTTKSSLVVEPKLSGPGTLSLPDALVTVVRVASVSKQQARAFKRLDPLAAISKTRAELADGMVWRNDSSDALEVVLESLEMLESYVSTADDLLKLALLPTPKISTFTIKDIFASKSGDVDIQKADLEHMAEIQSALRSLRPRTAAADSRAELLRGLEGVDERVVFATADPSTPPPSWTLRVMQAFQPEDFASLVPFVELVPCSEFGKPLKRGPKFEPVPLRAKMSDFAVEGKWKITGAARPSLFLDKVVISYAMEGGPLKTVNCTLEASIANPSGVEDRTDPVGHMLRYGSSFLLRYGYRPSVIRPIVERIAARERARGVAGQASVDEIVEAFSHEFVFKVASIELDQSLPYLWKISLRCGTVGGRLAKGGFFLGPAFAGSGSRSRAEELLERFSAQLDDLESVEEGAERDWLNLAKTAEKSRSALASEVAKSCSALLEVLKAPPPSLRDATLVYDGVGYVSLQFLIHFVMAPSYLAMATSLSRALVAPPGVPVSASKIVLAVDQPLPEYFFRLAEVRSEELAEMLPKSYREVMVPVKLVEEWLRDTVRGTDRISSLSAVYASFERRILHNEQSFVQLASQRSGISVPVICPKPTLALRFDYASREWVLDLIDFHDASARLEHVASLQGELEGPAASFASSYLARYQSPIEFGTNRSIVEQFKLISVTANDAANRHIGLNSESIAAAGGSAGSEIASILERGGRGFDSTAYSSAQQLSALITDLAAQVVSFTTPVAALDLEPMRLIRVRGGLGPTESFYVTKLTHEISKSRIASHVEAWSVVDGAQLARQSKKVVLGS